MATGWPLTDWVEDVLLRMHGPETYDRWIAHTIPFDGPAVVDAVERVSSVLRDDRYVNGGFGDVASIATTGYQEGGWPIRDGECALHRQGSFYANLWPAGTTVAQEGDVFAFYLPTDRPDAERPVLGAGHFVAAFDGRPEVDARPRVPGQRPLRQQPGEAGQLDLGPPETRRRERRQSARPAVGGTPPGPGDGLPVRRLRPEQRPKGTQVRPP
ncbi:hypothetical protein [Micromonospora sp. NPDC000442]|uniref:hypothetical protein n=1 Tax=Micromonospora sp. NPDC000442 TaxID=3364217 RepID=UPI0036927FF7